MRAAGNLPSIPWTERERAEFKRRLSALEAGGGGGGATDLSYNAATRLLESSTGADVTLPLAGTDAGLMSATDKTKLDGVAAGATAVVFGSSTITLTSLVLDWRQTVAAPGMTPGRVITPTLAAHLDTDENDPEFLDMAALTALAGTDQITFVAAFATLTRGPVKLNWSAF